MAFTTESIEIAPIGRMNQSNLQPNQFDLPSKEFVGYDPKGTTTITGSQIQRPDANSKQSNTSEAPVQPAAPQEEQIALSPKVSALARKEQAQRQREQMLARREKELADKIAAGEKFLAMQEKLKAKDYSGVDELGLSSNELASYEVEKMNALDPNEIRAKKLEEEIAAIKRAQEERELQDYEQNQSLWKQEISKIVAENEEFSTIKELGMEEAVLQHVNDSFEQDGVKLTAEQAAKEIEEALIARAEKFSSVSKIKNKQVSEAKVLGPPKTSSVKTITQQMTTTPKTAPTSKPFHLMSESEQIAEAFRRVQAAKLQR